MDKPTLLQRWRYWFDNFMGRGTGAMLAFLGAITVAFILVNTAIVKVLNQGEGGETETWAEILWNNTVSVLRSKDVVEGTPWAFRFAMLAITIIGVLIVANLIGIMAGAFNAKVKALNRGRSAVIERNHTAIIGWNSKIIQIVTALCEANESKGKSVIVIMADRDKVEMDEAIREKIADPGRTKIIVRSGDPLDQDDLLRVRPFRAKSVIVLASEEYPDSDARVIKIALALSRHPERPATELNLVGQIANPKNLKVAQLAGPDKAQWLLGTEKIGQITAQTSHQPGLSAVYSELLSFKGSEIYFSPQPTLAGVTYAEAQLKYAESTVIGVSTGGDVHLNPAPNTQLGADVNLIVIAEDDSKIAVTEPGQPDRRVYSKAKKSAPRAHKTLILGANLTLPHVLRALDAYSAKGSTVTIVSEFDVPPVGKFANASVKIVEGDASDRDTLDQLKPATYDHVIVLAYSEDLPVRQADTRTLVTLLHLRDIMETTGKNFNVVSEMLDEKNRRLAEVTKVNDFIVSDHLVSLMVAQVSESPRMAAVFADLFSAQGSEIYVRPADWYVKTGSTVDFYTVTGAASERNETAIGYMIAAHDGGEPIIAVSPSNAANVTFGMDDRIIVLAEG